MRAYQDLRAFLRVLEDEHQLLRVSEELLPEPDLQDRHRRDDTGAAGQQGQFRSETR